jgi:glucan phosphoethanolaminetransferase (alkaline phosphatase superfamily)
MDKNTSIQLTYIGILLALLLYLLSQRGLPMWLAEATTWVIIIIFFTILGLIANIIWQSRRPKESPELIAIRELTNKVERTNSYIK